MARTKNVRQRSSAKFEITSGLAIKGDAGDASAEGRNDSEAAKDLGG